MKTNGKTGTTKDAAVPEHPGLRAARMKADMFGARADTATQKAQVAKRTRDERAAAVAAKIAEHEKVKTELDRVGGRLSTMGLDDPKAEPLAGRHRHCELVAARLGAELETLRTALAADEEALAGLSKAAERAAAEHRNYQRLVKLVELQGAFAAALQPVLDLIATRRRVLEEAEEEAHASGLPTPPRARLFATKQQMAQNHGRDIEEVETVLGRLAAAAILTPGAVPADLAPPEPPAPEDDPELHRLIAEAASPGRTPGLKAGEFYFTPRGA